LKFIEDAMDLFWIYDIPTWKLGAGIVIGFTFFSISVVCWIRHWGYRKFDICGASNAMVNGIFSSVGLLFGLLVGLVAVSAWANFDRIDEIVSKEAATAGVLYRDVSALRSPEKQRMQSAIKDYLSEVIHVAWPRHHQGLSESEGGILLSRLHAEMARYRPTPGADGDFYRESLNALNRLEDARNLRLGEVTTGLPRILWAIIVPGALITFPLIGFFYVSKVRLHLFAASLYGVFMGSMMFLMVAIDYPLRGEVSISSEPYQTTLNNLNDPDIEAWDDYHPSLEIGNRVMTPLYPLSNEQKG